jgi:hypothetical protein
MYIVTAQCFVDPDPDPHGSTLILVGWIRIQEGKKGPTKI